MSESNVVKCPTGYGTGEILCPTCCGSGYSNDDDD